jgi:hypothetical protein
VELFRIYGTFQEREPPSGADPLGGTVGSIAGQLGEPGVSDVHGLRTSIGHPGGEVVYRSSARSSVNF